MDVCCCTAWVVAMFCVDFGWIIGIVGIRNVSFILPESAVGDAIILIVKPNISTGSFFFILFLWYNEKIALLRRMQL